MSDRPMDFEDDDIDMGEPVTDKLNLLLAELSDEWKREDDDHDLGEPVTDKLSTLLAALPDDWNRKGDDADISEQVTDRLTEMLDQLPDEDFSTRVHHAAEQTSRVATQPLSAPQGGLFGFVKRFFGR